MRITPEVTMLFSPINRTSTRAMVILALLLGVLAFLPGIDRIPPMDRDESRFAQASKQMLESGDLVTVRFQEELRAKKPVGIYWLQSASAAVFGSDAILSYRVPSLIAGFAVIGLGFGLARRLVTAREAGFAAILMATGLVMAAEAHLAKTDAMLVAVTLAQQALLFRIYSLYRDKHHISGLLALGFWATMAAGILIKGPITPLVAVLTLAVLAGRERSIGVFGATRPVLGFLTLTSLVLPWVMLVTSATDGAFLSTAIKGDLVGKLQSGQESHGAPPLTHLALLIITFWPGSLLLARAVPAIWTKKSTPEFLFLLGWIIPFWLVIELTPTKLPHYFLPVMPALAICASLGVFYQLPAGKKTPDDATDQSGPFRPGRIKNLFTLRAAIIGWEVLFALVSIGLGMLVLAAATFYGGDRLYGWIGLLLAVLIAGASVLWTRWQKPASIIAIAGLAALFHANTFGFVLPSLSDMHLAPRITSTIEAITPPAEAVAAAGYHEPSLVFSQGTDTLLFSPAEAALFLGEGRNGIALVETRALGRFMDTAIQAGISLEEVAKIRGFNISRGKRVTIHFFRAAN
jgi:4-amino-4-deoxy-L-arabinose transferase-like glycosyltransferase